MSEEKSSGFTQFRSPGNCISRRVRFNGSFDLSSPNTSTVTSSLKMFPRFINRTEMTVVFPAVTDFSFSSLDDSSIGMLLKGVTTTVMSMSGAKSPCLLWTVILKR